MFETLTARFITLLDDVDVGHRMFLDDPWVKDQAKEIATRTFSRNVKKGSARKDFRSEDEIYTDSVNGLALQMAVLTYLKDNGVDAYMEPNRKEWDIVVNENGEQYFIDVKGIFKENANNWCQTWWESENVPYLNHIVWYLCFDCRDDVEDAFEGYCTQDDFRDSQYGTPPYVPRHILNRP